MAFESEDSPTIMSIGTIIRQVCPLRKTRALWGGGGFESLEGYLGSQTPGVVGYREQIVCVKEYLRYFCLVVG